MVLLHVAIKPGIIVPNIYCLRPSQADVTRLNSATISSHSFLQLTRRAAIKKSNAIYPALGNRGRSTKAVQNDQQQPPGDGSKGSLDLAESFLGHDYYRILGINVNTPPAAIRRAYWQLQKKYHPDIAGEEGHAMALLLNEAYTTLMDQRRREAYEEQWRSAAALGFVGFTGQPMSKWSGPEWGEGVFVDEAACIGCQQCSDVAPTTFLFDSTLSKARVKVQWGDSEATIRRAVESCPVDCIHAVPRDDLAALEFLMQPRERASKGLFGGGWEKLERGSVFQAAQTFKKRLQKQQAEGSGSRPKREESSTQRAARMAADRQTWPPLLQWFWNLGQVKASEGTSSRADGRRRRKEEAFSWRKVFGDSDKLEVFSYEVVEEEVEELISFVRDWASMWASSSEVPLPMPFRCDPTPDGVQLTLVTIDSGNIASIGSLLIQVEAPLLPSMGKEEEAKEEEEEEVVFELRVKRLGLRGEGPLPGEGRIIKELRKALATRGSSSGYEGYHIPRRAV